MTTKDLRCGDVVTTDQNEQLVVAYADYKTGRFSWFGWPHGEMSIDKIKSVMRCTEKEHHEEVQKWIATERAGAQTMKVRKKILSLYTVEAKLTSSY
jgi:hypothetical protein